MGRLRQLIHEMVASLGRYAEADSMAEAYADRFPGPEGAAAARLRFRLEAVRGRLRSAEENLEDFLAATAPANPVNVARVRASRALVRGDSVEAVRIAREAHEGARATPSLPAASVTVIPSSSSSMRTT